MEHSRVLEDVFNFGENVLQEEVLQDPKVLNLLPVPVYLCDAEGRITAYNKAATKLWGRSPELGIDLYCGSHRILNIDGSELPLDACPMAMALKEGRPIYNKEIVIIRPNGEMRQVAPHPQPIFNKTGQLIGAINMLLDITELRRTENAVKQSEFKLKQLASTLEDKVDQRTKELLAKNEQLQESEERYHRMIEEVEDYAIILLDKNGVIQNWNNGAKKIKGYSQEEIVGKSFEIFYLEEDKASGLPKRLLKHAYDTGKAIHEGWRVRKDGSTFWGSIVLTALHSSDNEVIGFSKMTRDLTERKLAEDTLRQYTDQLEFQNRELEQFAYAASHDMKEPLRKIHFYHSYILEKSAHNLDERAKEYFNRSISAVQRMSNLIEDLLTYSRAKSGSETYEYVDFNEIVEEISFTHKDEFEEKKVHIDLGNLPVIHAVPFQVKQLMDNLINNSIKYKHPERDIVIKIRSEKVKLGTPLTGDKPEYQNEYHRITVIDNGIGFEPQYGEKIFEIFQRLNNLPGTKGSGIGLAICKKIMTNHRGFIKARGLVNEGARFDIYFPVNP